MAVENRLAALCFAGSQRTTRASRATNPRPSGLVALHLAESRQSYSTRSRCWQNDIDIARCCRRVIHAAGERELRMRAADLRREAIAVITKPAPVLLYDTAVWYLVWVCGCVLCDGMIDAIGPKNTCEPFSTGRSSRKSQVFRPSRKTQSQKLSRYSSFSTV